MTGPHRGVVASVTIVLMACGGSVPAPTAVPIEPPAADGPRAATASLPPHRIAYEAELHASFDWMDVRACFETDPPVRLRPGRRNGRSMLTGATIREGERWEPIATDEIGIRLAGADVGDCVGYRVAVGRGARGGGLPLSSRVGDGLFTTHGAWLWGPDDDRPVDATLQLRLPQGVEAVLPFPQSDGRYQLPRSTFRFLGFGAFGSFEPERLPVPGGVLDVAWLDPGEPMRASRQELRGWLQRAATATATLYGRFPVENACVTVVPIPGAGREGFGMVGRGGGPSVFLLVDTASTARDLDGNWVTVHEMSHLAAPYVRRTDAWLGEGLATYYQEVLRARGGLQSPVSAWGNLADGFRRGARSGSGATLARESAAVFDTREFVRVYWGGAAIAFLIDVELRRATGGRMSLDTAMAGLRTCCSEVREWTAAELIAQMDHATGERVVSRISSRWLGSTDYPDVEAAFELLGIRTSASGVELDPNVGAALRDAILTAPALAPPGR